MGCGASTPESNVASGDLKKQVEKLQGELASVSKQKATVEEQLQAYKKGSESGDDAKVTKLESQVKDLKAKVLELEAADEGDDEEEEEEEERLPRPSGYEPTGALEFTADSVKDLVLVFNWKTGAAAASDVLPQLQEGGRLVYCVPSDKDAWLDELERCVAAARLGVVILLTESAFRSHAVMLALRAVGAKHYNKNVVVVHVASSGQMPKYSYIPSDVRQPFSDVVTWFPDMKEVAVGLILKRLAK